MENWIAFKNKTEYHAKSFQPKAIKLLGSTKNMITKDSNGEIDHYLDNAEAVLVYCNIANNDYQYDLKVFYTFVTSKSFGQLFNISSEMFLFLKTFLFKAYWSIVYWWKF